jgi:hypothetical protein
MTLHNASKDLRKLYIDALDPHLVSCCNQFNRTDIVLSCERLLQGCARSTEMVQSKKEKGKRGIYNT